MPPNALMAMLPHPIHLNRPHCLLTRSHKHNDRDHVGLANGTALPEEHLPRYFAKHGHIDADPKKVKKEGGGKGNWGQPGAEAGDYGYNMTNERRRSNSSTHQSLGDFKTKFEAFEADPVFEEELHGVSSEDLDDLELAESTSGTSVDEEDRARKM